MDQAAIDELRLLLRVLREEGFEVTTIKPRDGPIAELVGMLKQGVAPPAATDAPEPVSEASLAAQILATLRAADKPLKGEAIAHRLGKDYSGRFRETLSNLRKAQQIDHNGDGYVSCPDNPVPPRVSCPDNPVPPET